MPGNVQRHEDIKGALRLRGKCLSDIARELSVAPTTVTIVSKGQRRSRRIEDALAAALGMEHEVLWPERRHNRGGSPMPSG